MKQEDVWALQLVYLFLDKYDYRLVSIGNNALKNELWLANPRGRFPVIRVTSLATSTNFFDRDRILKTKKAVTSLIHTEGELLSLHLTNEATDDSNADMVEVCVSENYISTDKLQNDYPELGTYLKPIDDPQSEFARISKDINLIQLKGFKHSQSWVKPKEISMTYIMMGICVVIYLISLYLTNAYGDQSVSAILVGALYKTFVYGDYEYWRLLTSGFVHVSFFHLLANMYALYFMGPIVERLYGKRNYVIALLGSIIVGSAFALIGNENTVTLGISGGLFGFLGMMLVYAFESNTIRDRRVFANFMQIILINLLISLMPGISLMGHLGGFIAGLFFGLIFSKKPSWKFLRRNSIIALCLLIMGLGYMSVNDTRKGPLYQGTDYDVIYALNDMHLTWYTNLLEHNLYVYYNTVEE